MASLDDLRRAYPHLGFALYALTPGGTVTFEVHAPGGDVFSFEGPTQAAAITTAFPPDKPTPMPAEPPPDPINVFN